MTLLRDDSAHAHQRTATQAHQPTSTPNLFHTSNKENQDQSGYADSEESPHSYWLDPLARAEKEERDRMGITAHDYGKRWRATFRQITGDSPVCRPGEREKARAYLERIGLALEQGGWSNSEWQSLYRLRRAWQKRVQGLDPRFEAVGTKPGRLVFEERIKVRQAQVAVEMLELASRRLG